jgi:hypothetical protein
MNAHHSLSGACSLATLLLCVACAGRAPQRARPAPECTRQVTILRSLAETPKPARQIGAATFSCAHSCEQAVIARACELHADAVLWGKSGRTPGGPGVVGTSNKETPQVVGSTVGVRDEQDNLIGARPRPMHLQEVTFLRWED